MTTLQCSKLCTFYLCIDGIYYYYIHCLHPLFYSQGSRQRFTSTLPVMHPLAWLDANNMFRKFDELGEGVSHENYTELF